MSTKASNDNRVIIFDTTLRDGEQSPGASMNLAEKLEIAHALAELGVDVIEAGFPIASPGDFEAVEAISRQVQGPIICGLARCHADDIDRAWNALKDATKPRIHVFLATSAIHREFKLHMDKDEIIRRAVEAVERAKKRCNDIEFSPEDAARTELDFLAEVVEKAIAAGATTVNIPDTVGYAVPAQYGDVFRFLKQNVSEIDRVVLSAHCHNDLGLAVANSVAAIMNGARQVECTVNGLGERAGNASLEEIVMAVRTRQDFFPCDTRIAKGDGAALRKGLDAAGGQGLPDDLRRAAELLRQNQQSRAGDLMRSATNRGMHFLRRRRPRILAGVDERIVRMPLG